LKNQLAACLILGDAFDDKELEQLFKSLEPHAKGIFVAYNGVEFEASELEQEFKKFWKEDKHLIRVQKFKWEENFALARQQSFDMVPKDKYDWMMWIDSDDIFHAPNGLDAMFESLDEYTKGIFIRYDYAVEPDTGLVVVEQWRERILATDTPWEWRYPLHEVAAAPPGVQFARRDDCWLEHMRKSGEDRGARPRNRKIIAKWIKEVPTPARAMFYFAGETMAEADIMEPGAERNQVIEAAIHAFEKFKELTPEINDDYYLANTRISELYRMMNDHPRAIESDLTSIAIYPDWPDGYVGAAKSCMEINDFRRMKAFADIATKVAKPTTVASIEPMMSGFYPYFLRAMACEHLGENEQAIRDYKKAKTFWNPPSGLVDDKIKLIKSRKAGNSPDEVKDVRKSLRGTRSDKSICFYTSPIPEVWHPKTIEATGSGGAEICVMEVAKRFAADGWRTVVFGTPGEHAGVHEGVEYWRSEDYLPSEPFKVFVSSRAPAPFEVDINAKLKLFWAHDVNVGETFGPVANRPDKIVGLTQWHTKHMSNLYNVPLDRFAVVPNGLNLDRFVIDRSDDDSNSPKFIWSSSPDRGLDVLLGLWPTIRTFFPDAELHIYYGWNMIDKIINAMKSRGQGGYLEYIKSQIIGKMYELGNEEGGIYNHGRVNQDELAKAMYGSTFWGYPTQFMETFCITAIENQAAGVIPVTSKLAALQETVAVKDLLVEGWPSNLDYQNRWLSLLIQIIEMEGEERQNLREIGRNYALQYSWENSYDTWNNLFRSLEI
jgi:glycosyltransferase involved in cell wall biosynthesis